MKDKSPESTLAARLRASEEQLDGETLARLQQIRRRAQQHTPASHRLYGVKPWQGWLLAASVAVVALLVALPRRAPETLDANAVLALEDGPHQDLDLYENLDFYEWLASQEDMG